MKKYAILIPCIGVLILNGIDQVTWGNVQLSSYLKELAVIFSCAVLAVQFCTQNENTIEGVGDLKDSDANAESNSIQGNSIQGDRHDKE